MIDVRSLRCAAAVGCLSAALASLASAESPRVPTIDDLLAVKTVGGAQISPDGRLGRLYASPRPTSSRTPSSRTSGSCPAGGGTPFQLTRGAKSAGAARWSPDGRWLAVHEPARRRSEPDLRDPSGRWRGGAADESGSAVGDFAWSPDGATIAFVAAGGGVEGRARRARTTWATSRSSAATTLHATSGPSTSPRRCKAPAAGTQRTEGQARSTSARLAWAPDSTRLAFSATANARSRARRHTPTSTCWRRCADRTRVTRTARHPGGARLRARGGPPTADSSSSSRRWAARTSITPTPASPSCRPPAARRDRSPTPSTRDPDLVAWTSGRHLFLAACRRPPRICFVVDPATARSSRISQPDALMAYGFSLSPTTARPWHSCAASPTSLAECS